MASLNTFRACLLISCLGAAMLPVAGAAEPADAPKPGQPTWQPPGQATGQPTGQPAGQPLAEPAGEHSGQALGKPPGDPPGQPPGQSPGSTAAAPTADRDVAILLQQTERQIADGHTMVPTSDNALRTWQHVLERLSPPSPATIRALSEFESMMRDRAAADEAAGRTVVASDRIVFADQAAELLKQDAASAHSPEVPTPPAPSTPPTAAYHDAVNAPPLAPTQVVAREVLPSSPAAGAEPPAAPIRLVPDAKALTPDPAEGRAAVPLPTALTTPPLRVAPPAATTDPAMAAGFAERGDAMLAIRDISAARKFYQFAADAGSARAATALARTYDPAFAARLGILGLKPDPQRAAEWYRRAATLQSRDDADAAGRRVAAVHQEAVR